MDTEGETLLISHTHVLSRGEEQRVIADNCVVTVRHIEDGIEVCVFDEAKGIEEPGISFVVPRE